MSDTFSTVYFKHLLAICVLGLPHDVIFVNLKSCFRGLIAVGLRIPT